MGVSAGFASPTFQRVHQEVQLLEASREAVDGQGVHESVRSLQSALPHINFLVSPQRPARLQQSRLTCMFGSQLLAQDMGAVLERVVALLHAALLHAHPGPALRHQRLHLSNACFHLVITSIFRLNSFSYQCNSTPLTLGSEMARASPVDSTDFQPILLCMEPPALGSLL